MTNIKSVSFLIILSLGGSLSETSIEYNKIPKATEGTQILPNTTISSTSTELKDVPEAEVPQTFKQDSGTSRLSDLKIIDQLLRTYDRRATPTNKIDKPTEVGCELFIRSFGSISEKTMDYQVDLYLRQHWEDPRLNHQAIKEALDLNDPNLVKAIWKPEVYFPNAKEGEFQYVTVPNVLLRIKPFGQILYMLRLKMKFSCMMELFKYPLDVQVCTMEIASFSKTTKELLLEWNKKSPVDLSSDLKLPQFTVESVVTDHCEESSLIGNYSCLVAKFHLSRSIGFHMVQSYVPTILIVVISWVSFWMDVDSVPGRTTLGVTTLLTVSSKSAGIRDRAESDTDVNIPSSFVAEVQVSRLGIFDIHHLYLSSPYNIPIFSSQQAEAAAEAQLLEERSDERGGNVYIRAGFCPISNAWEGKIRLNAETPQVSYVKAIDVWMGACTAFIFAALIEFTLVNYLWRKSRFSYALNNSFEMHDTASQSGHEKIELHQSGSNVKIFDDHQRILDVRSTNNSVGERLNEEVPVSARNFNGAGEARFRIAEPMNMGLRVDEACRIFFPLLFLCFNIFYWWYYLYHE